MTDAERKEVEAIKRQSLGTFRAACRLLGESSDTPTSVAPVYSLAYHANITGITCDTYCGHFSKPNAGPCDKCGYGVGWIEKPTASQATE